MVYQGLAEKKYLGQYLFQFCDNYELGEFIERYLQRSSRDYGPDFDAARRIITEAEKDIRVEVFLLFLFFFFTETLGKCPNGGSGARASSSLKIIS